MIWTNSVFSDNPLGAGELACMLVLASTNWACTSLTTPTFPCNKKELVQSTKNTPNIFLINPLCDHNRCNIVVCGIKLTISIILRNPQTYKENRYSINSRLAKMQKMYIDGSYSKNLDLKVSSFMLFINISSDKVQIADAKQEIFLERNSIETTLGKTLVDRYKTSPFTQILLLNWPGGFTNLRVGTLTLNLLHKLIEHTFHTQIKIYSLTKFDLYTYLFQKWFLPENGLIYIGQRENIRLYNTPNKTYEQIKIDTINNEENLFFDYVKDDYRGENTPNMLSFQMNEQWLQILRKDQKYTLNISDLWLQAQSQVKPEYMIEAVQ